MIKRDKTSCLLAPELFKRFKSKNIKIAIFSLEVVVDALRNGHFNEESTLKQIFKGLQDIVGHNNKELKDRAIELLIEIYKVSSDDTNSFTKNLKALRPI